MKRLFVSLLSIIMLISVASATVIYCFDVPAYYRFGTCFQVSVDGVGRVYEGVYPEDVLPDVPGEHMLVDFGYIMVKDNSKYSIYYAYSGEKITDWYTEISEVKDDIAVCGDGEWVPPGILRGNYGAVNLKTGKTVVPIKWWGGVKISPDGEHLIGHGNDYGVYNRNGIEVTDIIGAVPYEENGNYYTTLDAKNKLFGLSDKEGNKLISPQFKSVRNAFSGALVAYKDGYYGAMATDGSEEVLIPFKYLDFVAYGNDIFALKENGYVADNNFQNEVEVYYGDGSRAPIYGYASLQFSLGDVLFLKKYNDNTLYCVSKTGQVLDSFENGFLSFYADTHDYVLVGNTEVEQSFIVVNKWGERLTDGRGGEVLSSDSIGGKGLSLYDMNTEKTRFLMADGFEIKDAKGVLDSKRGLIVAEIPTGVFSVVPIHLYEHNPEGIYESVEMPTSYTMGSITRKTDGYVVKNRHRDNSYEIYEVGYHNYWYNVHSWAKEEIEAAKAAGIMPEDYLEDLRDGCTREQFCENVMNMLKACGYEAEGEFDVSFKDTDNEKVLQAARLGIVNGIGNGRFAPNRPVTREAAATMLHRAAKLLGLEANGAAIELSDIEEISPWAREAVLNVSAMKNGEFAIMQGVGENKFSPMGMYSNEQGYITTFRIFNLYMEIQSK